MIVSWTESITLRRICVSESQDTKLVRFANKLTSQGERGRERHTHKGEREEKHGDIGADYGKGI